MRKLLFIDEAGLVAVFCSVVGARRLSLHCASLGLSSLLVWQKGDTNGPEDLLGGSLCGTEGTLVARAVVSGEAVNVASGGAWMSFSTLHVCKDAGCLPTYGLYTRCIFRAERPRWIACILVAARSSRACLDPCVTLAPQSPCVPQ